MKNPSALTEAAISVGYFTLAFMAYYFSSNYSFVRKIALRLGDTNSQPEIRIYLERFFGFLLLGLVPGIYIKIISDKTFQDYGLSLPSGKNIWLWWLIPTVIFVSIYFIRPEKGLNTGFYPQVRKDEWNFTRILRNALTWLFYLAGYEFAFRGWLFFTCLHAFGFLPAVMINCAVYSISHIPKGIGEAFGAFFLGFLFCVVAKNTGSFLIPLTLHLILAVGNDLKAISVNPQMRFILKK